MFKIEKDYEGNGFKLSAGIYTREKLISLYGTEDCLNYCLNCTSLKEVLIPLSEKEIKKMDKTPRLVKAFLNGFENKSENTDVIESKNTQEEGKNEVEDVAEEVVEDVIEEVVEKELTLEEYKKIADEKGIPYHHKAGINKLKQLIKDSDKQSSVPTTD